MKTLLVVTFVASFSACCLYGQTFGEVTGRVTDTSGEVIPGASVTLTNTNAVRNVVSTEAGAYTFPSIAPGFTGCERNFRVSSRRPANHSKSRYNRSCVSTSFCKWARLARRSGVIKQYGHPDAAASTGIEVLVLSGGGSIL